MLVLLFWIKRPLLVFEEISASIVISALEPVISKSLEQSEEIVVVPDTSSQAYDTLENVEINKDKVIKFPRF